MVHISRVPDPDPMGKPFGRLGLPEPSQFRLRLCDSCRSLVVFQVPHLDARKIGGKPMLLFGPFAGFSPRLECLGAWVGCRL